MRLIAMKGRNFRNYIKIEDVTVDDLNNNYFKILESIVSRTEYKPYLQGFNKNLHESYLINKTWIPAQFFQDIITHFFPVYRGKIDLEQKEVLFNSTINRSNFQDYAESLVLPEHFDIFAEEYAYQLECVFRSILFKTARIEVGTGGGKTLITYMYCRYLIENFLQEDKKILIVVPRTLLAKQTKKNFEEFQELNDVKIPIDTIYSGAKRVHDAKIVIGTWQSLCDYEQDFFDDFSVMICDEAHSAKAYSIRKGIYDKCLNVEYLFGMTGTYPEFKSIDYLNIVAMFGPLVFVKKTHELIDDGNVCPVEIVQVKLKYSDFEKTFSQRLIDSGIVGGEKYRVEKAWFQTHLPRTDIMVDIISENKGNHLILVETVEYVEFLQDYIQDKLPDRKCVIIHGSVKDKVRSANLDLLDTETNLVLIATYETMSTGVSKNAIFYVHFPDGGRSPIRIKQSVGRGLRKHPDKEYLIVFDYQDEIPRCSFKNHASDRNKIYKTEKLPVRSISYDVDENPEDELDNNQVIELL